jgi:predicted Ser/Thr protein kinase
MPGPVTEHPTPEQLGRLRSGALPADDAARLDAHLRNCAQCRERLANSEHPTAQIEGVDTSVVPAPADAAGVRYDGSQLVMPAAPRDNYATVMSSGLSGPGPAGSPSGTTPGQTFGDYELVEFVANGGMGVVYRARQRSLGRTVALKMIRGDMLGTDQAVQRFYQEARAAAALDHPNIVSIYEIGEQNGHHFFTMAFVAGKRLGLDVTPEHPLPPAEAAEVMLPVSDAVHFAHQHGIIHRDLKPDNVLIDSQGRPRVTDFGLAKHLQTDAHLTSPGTILGTPEYMAPEQALGQEDKIGPATDVYALGGILYFLLTGRPPFEGGNTTEVLSRLLVETPKPPREINPNVPEALSAICARSLAKDPAGRYPSAAAFKAALLEFLGRHTEARAAARPVAPARSSGIGSLAALGAMLVAIIVAVLLWYNNREPDRTGGQAAIVPPAKNGPGPAPGPAAPPEVRPARFEWPPVTHKEFPLKVEIVDATKGADGVYHLTEGDNIFFRVEPARDANIMLWTMDATGTIHQLFPNDHEPLNRVPAGESRVIPGQNVKDYWIEATPSAGVEYVRVVATTSNVELPKGQKKEGPYQVFTELESQKRFASTFRSLVLKSATDRKDAVSEAELRFIVAPKK